MQMMQNVSNIFQVIQMLVYYKQTYSAYKHG